MPQYAVLVYLPAPADPAEFDSEYLELLERYPDRASQLGGKILGGSYFAAQRGFAFERSTTAVAVHGETVRNGTLIDSDLVVAALFVLSAPDMDVAVRIARLHPAVQEGGVEVRPVFPAP